MCINDKNWFSVFAKYHLIQMSCHEIANDYHNKME